MADGKLEKLQSRNAWFTTATCNKWTWVLRLELVTKTISQPADKDLAFGPGQVAKSKVSALCNIKHRQLHHFPEANLCPQKRHDCQWWEGAYLQISSCHWCFYMRVVSQTFVMSAVKLLNIKPDVCLAPCPQGLITWPSEDKNVCAKISIISPRGQFLSVSGFLWIWTEEGMNEKGNKALQAMLSPILIFRRHLPWIHWALWHATLRSVAPSRLQTLTMASLPPTVRGDIADVPQAGEGTCLPSCLQWVILCEVLSFSVDMLSTFPAHEHSWASRQMFWI